MATATRYVWSKYSRASTTTVTQGTLLMSSGSKRTYAISSSYYHVLLCSAVTYSGGTWTASGSTKHGIYSAASGTDTSDCVSYSATTYPYMLLTSSSSSTSSTLCFVTTGSKWYFHANGSSISNCKNLYIYAKSGSIYYATTGTTYTKGSTNYGYVSSSSSSTYPSDGVYGSYWYTYLGTDSFGIGAKATFTPSTPITGDTLTISFTPVSNTYGGTITYQYWYQTFTEDEEAMSSGEAIYITDYDMTLLSETTGTSVALTVPDDAAYLVVVVFAVSDGLGWTQTSGGYYTYAATYTWSAPTAPEDIGADGSTYTGMIFTGDTITVTWSESTDVDGDLAGYTVQRSYNGGSYTAVYQGTALTCTDTAASTWTTVQYRVRAYDAEGLYSDWTYSGEYDVDENTAPTAPTTVTLPATIYLGVQYTVSWAASTDAEADTVYYEVAVSYDGGTTWTTVTSKTTATSLTATITSSDITTIQYRVRAYDMYGAYSDWTESSSRTVIANTAPVLTVLVDGTAYDSGTDLGELTDGPTLTITVTDVDADDCTVTAVLDSTSLLSDTVESGAGSFVVTPTWQTILNGTHSFTVTASDGEETVTWTATFTKAVDSCTIGKVNTVSTGSTITGVLMSITGSIPDDASVTCMVTADGTNWEDASAEVLDGETYYFTNTGDSFDFEITIDGNGTDGYVSSIQGVLLTE